MRLSPWNQNSNSQLSAEEIKKVSPTLLLPYFEMLELRNALIFSIGHTKNWKRMKSSSLVLILSLGSFHNFSNYQVQPTPTSIPIRVAYCTNYQSIMAQKLIFNFTFLLNSWNSALMQSVSICRRQGLVSHILWRQHENEIN